MLCHSNSKLINVEEAYSVLVPPATPTYQPVSNKALILELDYMLEYKGWEVSERQYALANNGQRLFGCYKLEHHNTDLRPCLAFRNSYDKSVSMAVATGAKVLVCDNLQIFGSSFTMLRKHTPNVLNDMGGLISQGIDSIEREFTSNTERILNYKDIPVSLDAGYSLLGILRGRGVLNSKCYNIALREWQKPTIEEFTGRNLWSLYNTCTEGLKGLNANDAMGNYVKFDNSFKQLAA